MNPLDMHGPEFLGFFCVAVPIGYVVAWGARTLLATPRDEPERRMLELDPYEVAYLSGGPKRAAEAAVASLVQSGALTADATSRRVTLTTKKLGELHPLEEAVVRATEPLSARVDELLKRVKESAEPTAKRLRQWKLVLDGDARWTSTLASLAIASAVPLLGLAKIAVGISRDRPVALLVILEVIAAIATLVLFARPRLRTGRGERALEKLTRSNAALRAASASAPKSLEASELALAVGLFGTSVLVGTHLLALKLALAPPPAASGGGSCGGSSCGSSCGGGGCGGGGCGGCGS